MNQPVWLRRQWFLALLLLLPCSSHGESLTFARALELAIGHYGELSSKSPTEIEPRDVQTTDARNRQSTARASESRLCPVRLQDYAGTAARIASAHVLGLPEEGPVFAEDGSESAVGAFDLRSRRDVILCAALLYARLEGIQAEEVALHRQQEYVDRLLDIESRRVSADVDHPLLLTRAKLLRARTHMESLALGTSERKARAALSVLTGLLPDEAGPVENSMPPLSDSFEIGVENRETLHQLTAYRDVVQLEYAAEFASRLKATHDMVLVKASIGDLVAAHVSEETAWIALLELNNRLRMAKIQFLGASGDLETWALGRSIPNSDESSASRSETVAGLPRQTSSAASDALTPSLLFILISPAVKELPAGKSQQFSAFVSYKNGRLKDVTAEAVWNCSSDTAAIVSTTGLMTGLSAGEATIQASFHGLSQSRKVTITAQQGDEYLDRDH